MMNTKTGLPVRIDSERAAVVRKYGRSFCLGILLLSGWLLGGCSGANNVQLKVVAMDMQTPGIYGSEIDCLAEGDYVTFEMQNINPFVYDVTINAQSLAVFTAIPEVFKNIKGGVDVAAPGALPQEFRELTNPISEYTAVEAQVQSRMEPVEEKFEAFQDAGITASQHLMELESAIGSASALLSRPFLSRPQALDGFDTIIRTHMNLNPVSKGKITAIGIADVGNLQSALNELRTAVGLIQANLATQRAGLRPKLSSDADAAVLDAQLAVLENDYKRRLKQAEDWFTAYLEGKPVERFNLLGAAYDAVGAADFTRRLSVQAQKDFLEITYSAVPREKNLFGIPLTVPPLPASSVRIPVCKGVKIDFSTGMIFSDLVNHTYTLRDTGIYRPADIDAGRPVADTLPAKQLVLDKLDVLSFGFGGMMHIHSKYVIARGWTFPALSFGVFANNSSNLVYTLGLSTSLQEFGARFVISGGGALTKVKRILNPLEDNSVVPVSEIGSLNSEVTRDKYELGWFLGFTWNLP